jgi:hypothetical protein
VVAVSLYSTFGLRIQLIGKKQIYKNIDKPGKEGGRVVNCRQEQTVNHDCIRNI